jgi:CubicO group peptidase (beta-lactamase class C family)
VPAGFVTQPSEFETEVGRLLMRFNTPGVAVELVAGNKRSSAHMGRLTAGGSFPITKRARFATVCLVKVLVAVDLLALAEKGEISLDDKIADHLPELGKGPTAKGAFLNIRHLLSHTGGFRGHEAPHLFPLVRASWQNCVDLLHDTAQMFEPGTVFDDDHLSHIILGELLSRLRGKPVLDAVCEDVLAPLGITYGDRNSDAGQPEIYAARHAWDGAGRIWIAEPDIYPEPDPSFGAISPLSMTSGQFLKLGQALLADAPGPAPISPWVKQQLFSEAVRIPRQVRASRVTRWDLSAFGMGMAAFCGGHRGFVTTGRGQTSCLIFDQSGQSVLALAMNTTNVLEREVLLNTLLATFASDASIVPEPPLPDIGFDEFIHPFTPGDLHGIYVGFTNQPIEILSGPRSFVIRIDKEDRYLFESGPQNQLVVRAKMPVPVGMFQDPSTRRPCLTMAMHPFMKVR